MKSETDTILTSACGAMKILATRNVKEFAIVGRCRCLLTKHF